MDDDLELIAIKGIHKVAIDYSDALVAQKGVSKKDASLDAMGVLVIEATIIARAMGLTAEDLQKAVGTAYEMVGRF